MQCCDRRAKLRVKPYQASSLVFEHILTMNLLFNVILRYWLTDHIIWHLI